MKKQFKVLRIAILTTLVVLSLTGMVAAQKRDNLTDAEDLKVREAQELDLRMKAYVKIVSRRLAALTPSAPTVNQTKSSKKDSQSEWGELRQGTTQELFWDIRKTLDEAINKIDDSAARDQKNPLLGKATHILTDGCREWTPQFQTFLDRETQSETKGLIQTSLEMCQQITEASSKVSKDVPKEKKKKT